MISVQRNKINLKNDIANKMQSDYISLHKKLSAVECPYEKLNKTLLELAAFHIF